MNISLAHDFPFLPRFSYFGYFKYLQLSDYCTDKVRKATV